MMALEKYFNTIDLGRLDYAPALEYQRKVNQGVIDGKQRPALLLVEHNPVITVSYKKNSAKHLIASKDKLKAMGIDVQQTDRGGDITYHGPGQLVVYPILKLVPLGLNLSRYMRFLEQVVIDTIAPYGITGHREQGATGVWVDIQTEVPAKVCAMGVRIRKNVTMHGLALNVNVNLDHFDTIVPCGIYDRKATSLHALLNENNTPSMDKVKHDVVEQFEQAVNRVF